MDDIDCTKVLHALYEFLDGELTSERRQHIELHLNGCPHCFSAFDFEAELRIVVRSRLRAEVPPDLRRRISDALEREGFHPLPDAAAPRLGGSPLFGPAGGAAFGGGGPGGTAFGAGPGGLAPPGAPGLAAQAPGGLPSPPLDQRASGGFGGAGGGPRRRGTNPLP